MVAEKALGAFNRPFHWTAEPFARQQQRPVPMTLRLRAEGAADIAGQHVQLVRRHAELMSRARPPRSPADALAADIQRPAPGRRIGGRSPIAAPSIDDDGWRRSPAG